MNVTSVARSCGEQLQDSIPTTLGIEYAAHLLGGSAETVETSMFEFDPRERRPERHKAHLDLRVDT